MALGVQDPSGRPGAAAEAELDGVAGSPRGVRRQAVQERGGLARAGQRRPDQPGIGADVSGEDVCAAGHAARQTAGLTTR
jgi:hypothetical protein